MPSNKRKRSKMSAVQKKAVSARIRFRQVLLYQLELELSSRVAAQVNQS